MHTATETGFGWAEAGCVRNIGESIRSPRNCLLNRECFHCAHDQWLEAMDESLDGEVEMAAPDGVPVRAAA